MALPENEIKDIIELRKDGYSYQKIADKTNHSPTTVRRYCKDRLQKDTPTPSQGSKDENDSKTGKEETGTKDLREKKERLKLKQQINDLQENKGSEREQKLRELKQKERERKIQENQIKPLKNQIQKLQDQIEETQQINQQLNQELQRTQREKNKAEEELEDEQEFDPTQQLQEIQDTAKKIIGTKTYMGLVNEMNKSNPDPKAIQGARKLIKEMNED